MVNDGTEKDPDILTNVTDYDEPARMERALDANLKVNVYSLDLPSTASYATLTKKLG